MIRKNSIYVKKNLQLRFPCAALFLLTVLFAARAAPRVCLIASGCAGAPQASDVRVFLDGKAWDGAPISPAGGDGLRVYITYDGQPLLDAPFGERRSVRILQADGSENTVAITGDAVYMEHANCENQDCVQMGAVTRDNLELRVMGGFIVCLPHRISVEVRGE